MRHPDPDAQEVAAVLGRRWQGIEAAVVLGSGLGGGADSVRAESEVSWKDLPGFRDAAVPGHEGRLVLGRAGGLRVALFRGRRHVYEGLSAAQAALPARVAAALGARAVVLLSAVGALDPALRPGDWIFLEDHLNLMGRNPLEGVRGLAGPAFVDLTHVYRADLYPAVAAALEGRGLTLGRGVLASFPGPSYETPAEVRAARLLGASVVGMSTVPEAVWARYQGLDVIALGRVSNLAAGLGPGPLDHAAVLRAGAAGAGEAAAVVDAALSAWHCLPTGSRDAGRYGHGA